uniref:Hes family bHLH transcription factor 3 n=1 Tax=Macaca nemestrina TaxID=9545 RepID=A0A2K6BCQ7_MACNE
MEKKRRARINVSLEQLKSLLEKHYSHQIRKRKLEKADILELSVKYMRSLQNSLQGLWPVPSETEPVGFLLRRGDEVGGGLLCPGPERPRQHHGQRQAGAGGSRAYGPAPRRLGSCSAAGAAVPPPRSSSPEVSRLVRQRSPPQPASSCCAESPGLGLRVWRPGDGLN